MSTPTGGVVFNDKGQARSTLQNSRFVDRTRLHPGLPFGVYPSITTPSSGTGVTVLITGPADAYDLYPGLISHVNVEDDLLFWYQFNQTGEIDESCTVMVRNAGEVLVTGQQYHGELVGVMAGIDDIPPGSAQTGCPNGHEGELLFVCSGTYTNTEQGTGTGDDPEVVTYMSDCYANVRTVVYAKLEIINNGGKLVINPYSYRLETQCCCADPTGTVDETGTAGTATGGTGTTVDGGTSTTCGYTLGALLYASLTGGYGTVTLTWDGIKWAGDKALGCGEHLYLRYYTDDTLDYSCDGSTWADAAMLGTVECSPYSVSFIADILRVGVGGCSGTCPSLIVTITE